MIVQVLDAQARGLARPRPGDGQRIDQQAELLILRVGGGDEGVNLWRRDMTTLRAVCASGSPARPTSHASRFLMRGSCCADSSSAAQNELQSRLMVAGAILPSRPSRHCFSSFDASNMHRLRQQRRGQMIARVPGVVGTRAARDQVGLVVDERAVDRERCGYVDLGIGAAARELLRDVLRFEERQDARAVVRSSKSSASAKRLGPVIAVTIRPPSTPKCRCPCCAGRAAAFRARASGPGRACGEPRTSVCWCGFRRLECRILRAMLYPRECLKYGRGVLWSDMEPYRAVLSRGSRAWRTISKPVATRDTT